MQNTGISNSSIPSTKNVASDQHSSHIDGRLFVDSVDEGKLMQLCRVVEASESSHWPQAQRDGMILSSGQNSQEVKCPIREVDAGFSNVVNPSVQALKFAALENSRSTWEVKNMHESSTQPSLSMSLGTPSCNSVLPSAGEIIEGRGEEKPSPFHQGQRSRPILPKPLKTGLTLNQEPNKGMMSQARIARPPAEGKGKSQLLPRYWPRISDKELEQLSGEYP